MIRILFVCTGNTCRSPMAEAILKASLANTRVEGVEASSAGTDAFEGEPAAEEAVNVLGEKGIPLQGHSSRMLTGGMVSDADLIVAMTRKHLQDIVGLYPEASSKVLLLGGLDGERDSPDIRDPIGGGRERYLSARDEIADLVALLIPYINERFRPKGQ